MPTVFPGALRLLPFLPGLLGGWGCHAAPSGYLNDSGQTACYDASHAAVACDLSGVGSDGGELPRQDGRFGRDARVGPGKTGGGAAGFDFTRLCMDGTVDCAGAANTGASPAAGDWACTRDNLTHLVWSLETISSTWPDATAVHAANYNNAARCGFAGAWRLPTLLELLGLVHHGASWPAIDADYFPGTSFQTYWSSDAWATDPDNAWNIRFTFGYVSVSYKGHANNVRLVRDGQ